MSILTCEIYGIQTTSNEKGTLIFSRSDGRNSGPNLSRIDRIYVGEALEAKGGWCRITPSTTLPGNRSFSIALKVGPIPTLHPSHYLHNYRGEGTTRHTMVITHQ